MSGAGTICTIIVAAILVGCQFDPHADLYTTSEPEEEYILGTYVLDWLSLPSEARVNMPEISIEVRANGMFSATNIPPWDVEVGDGFASSLVSGDGHWKKEPMGILDPGRRTIWGICLQTPEQAEFSSRWKEISANLKEGDALTDFPKVKFLGAKLIGQKPPYGLMFTLGDPDSGHAIILKRTGD